MKRFLLLTLLTPSLIHSMEESNTKPLQYHQPSSLVSLCLKKLTNEIDLHLSSQCDLLAQVIDARFTKARTSIEAKEKLKEIATVSQENHIFKITPVSIHLKGMPQELNEESAIKERAKKIIPQLYVTSAIVRDYVDSLTKAPYCDGWKICQLEPPHLLIALFLNEKFLEAREERERRYVKSWPRDEWCP